MMSMPSSDPYPYSSPSPQPPRKRLAPILAAVAVVVVLVVGGGLAAFFAGDAEAQSSSSSSDSGPRRTTAEIARKGLNCLSPAPVTDAVAPAQERVSCETGGGSSAVVSTFTDAKAARADAEKVLNGLSDQAKDQRGMVVGPYWTVNCSLRVVCESAQAFLDGELIS